MTWDQESILCFKPRSFFFHFNKPASRKAGKPQITVHLNGRCHIVDNVHVNVPTYGRINKRQPMFVIAGRASQFDLVNGVMYIGSSNANSD